MRVEFTLAVPLLLATVAPAFGASARAHHGTIARSLSRRAENCVCSPATSFSSKPGAIALALPAHHNTKKRHVPSVKPSKKSLQHGASQAVQDFVSAGTIPASVGNQIKQALNQSISSNTHSTTAPASVVSNNQNVVWSTNSTANNMSTTAILNIQKAIQDALNAVTLAENQLNGTTQAQLEKCLSTVLSNGGLPQGYSCITTTGTTSAQLNQTLNNILEQFLGILPNKILEDVFNAVTPQLTNLLPEEQTLVNNIKESIESITASASGNSVTALELLQNCYTQAVQANGNTSFANCYTSSGAYQAIQNGMNGILNQFVGVLPPELINSVQNLVAYQLGTTNNASQATVYQQLNNALLSVGASLSGSTVSIFMGLEQCAQRLLIDHDAAAAQNCTQSASIQQASETLVNSIAQQFAGYLPSSFFTDLMNAAAPYLQSSNHTAAQKSAVAAALQASFDNSHLGPSYVTCFEQIQACLVNAVVSSGNVTATCAGPIKGCERIGASGNGGLASSSSAAAATPAAASASSHSSTPSSSASAIHRFL